MRLLNVESRMLEDFVGQNVPKYAILSHTWGSLADEVLFADVNDPNAKNKVGYAKVDSSCKQALRDGLGFIWIDTCCIDKSSSAELSESINKMFKWYQEAKVCYVHIADCSSSPVVHNQRRVSYDSAFEEDFKASKWFTRGWTLQELLAPQDVQFFGDHWQFLGSKLALLDLVSQKTGIDRETLNGTRQLHDNSIARRMSWAAHRHTTRIEDVAYSLLGLFDVNMPLLYGEGNKAFIRLQEEVSKNSMDHSLFAWEDVDPGHLGSTRRGLLARSPQDFVQSRKIVPFKSLHHKPPYSMTNKGLELELPLVPGRRQNVSIALLDCHYENDFSGCIGIELIENEFGIFERRTPCRVKLVRHTEQRRAAIRNFYGLRDASSIRDDDKISIKCHYLVRYSQPIEKEFLLKHAECWKGIDHSWSGPNMVLSVGFSSTSDNFPRLAGFFMSHKPSQRNIVVLLVFFVSTSSVFSTSRFISPVGVLVLPEPIDISRKALLEEWEAYLEIDYLGNQKPAWDRHLSELGMKQCEIDDEYEVRVDLKEEQIFGETIWVIDVAKVRSNGHRWCGEHSHHDAGRLCAHFPAEAKNVMTERDRSDSFAVDEAQIVAAAAGTNVPPRTTSNSVRRQLTGAHSGGIMKVGHFSDDSDMTDRPDYEGTGYASYEEDEEE